MCLRALHEAGHDIALVVTGADKRRGRNQPPTPTAVKEAALSLRLEVSHTVADVTAVGAELGVVVAFGRIIKPDVLERLAMVNVHFSLLPRWRGAAPVERAILAGDPRTGVCLMAVEEGLDTGGVYRRFETPIDAHETAAQLTSRLAVAGASLLVEALESGLGEAVAQAGEATYASKIDPSELELDFARPAVELDRVVRVGRAWTTWRGRRLLILEAEVADPSDNTTSDGRPAQPGELGRAAAVGTGLGALRLLRVQPEGRAPVQALDWIRGSRPSPGERLGS